LSGGERARLALALITRDAPHLLILDEPTNHLDVDAREALVQALNGYDGAVILVSHDRHMVELTADRLVLVDGGTAVDYAAASTIISTSSSAGTRRGAVPTGRRRSATARTNAGPRPRRAPAASRCAARSKPPRRRSPGWRRARPRSSAPCSIPPPPRPATATAR
jgi:ATP-binding cassette subfamily F protein 3